MTILLSYSCYTHIALYSLWLNYYTKMTGKQQLKFDGYAFIEKTVKNSGDSGRIFVPISWVGKKVAVVLLEPVEEKGNGKE